LLRNAVAIPTLREKSVMATCRIGHAAKFASRRFFSGWTGKGQDMLEGAYTHGLSRPKVYLDAYGPTGFDIANMIKKMNPVGGPYSRGRSYDLDDENDNSGGLLYMNGSIMMFPYSCFLWKVDSIEDVTMETLAPLLMYRPKLEYFFLGSQEEMDRMKLDKIRKELKSRGQIIMDKMDMVRTCACN
jgi:hypothetical protein